MEDRVLQQCSPMGCSCDEGWVQDPCWHYLGGWALWVASLALVDCPHTVVVCFPVTLCVRGHSIVMMPIVVIPCINLKHTQFSSVIQDLAAEPGAGIVDMQDPP